MPVQLERRDGRRMTVDIVDHVASGGQIYLLFGAAPSRHKLREGCEALDFWTGGPPACLLAMWRVGLPPPPSPPPVPGPVPRAKKSLG